MHPLSNPKAMFSEFRRLFAIARDGALDPKTSREDKSSRGCREHGEVHLLHPIDDPRVDITTWCYVLFWVARSEYLSVQINFRYTSGDVEMAERVTEEVKRHLKALTGDSLGPITCGMWRQSGWMHIMLYPPAASQTRVVPVRRLLVAAHAI